MTKKIIVLLIAVMFIGISMMGLTSANAQCGSCCNSCQSAYNAAVGGSAPSDNDFRDYVEGVPKGISPQGFDCVIGALVAFGGCCGIANCLENAAFYICVGWGLQVYMDCEEDARTTLNSCQASCSCCGGC